MCSPAASSASIAREPTGNLYTPGFTTLPETSTTMIGAMVGVAGKVIAGSGLVLAAEEALPWASRKKIPPTAKKAAKTIKTARS